MTPEAQRIAIAEACGWTFIETLAFTGIPKGRRGNADARVIPDYLNDMNAMAVAEATMQPEQWRKWTDIVSSMLWRQDGHGNPRSTYQMFAELSAAQRAEAFLRTKGLWTE